MIIGQTKALGMAVRNRAASGRLTNLTDKIRKEY